MIEYYRLYLPKSRREVKMEVSVPRYRANITFDTLYLLDGQNAFKDSHAAFGKSIRAAKALGFAAKEMNKRILGVAIYNSGSDMGRINEYTPFPIDNPADINWINHDVQNCFNFCDDFISTIIPFIEKKYKTFEDMRHRFIYGSSLAAVTAIYLGVHYPHTFSYIGAFSTASFLFERRFFEFMENSRLSEKNIFLYVGKKEDSDNVYDSCIYVHSSFKIYEYLKKRQVRTRLVIDTEGNHNEATWERHILDFINFIYSDDVFYSYG